MGNVLLSYLRLCGIRYVCIEVTQVGQRETIVRYYSLHKSYSSAIPTTPCKF
jgi:hypothetical protein